LYIESNRRDNSVNPLIVPTKKKKDSPSKKHQINPPLQKPEAGTPADRSTDIVLYKTQLRITDYLTVKRIKIKQSYLMQNYAIRNFYNPCKMRKNAANHSQGRGLPSPDSAD
jgi:hypothetical protein